MKKIASGVMLFALILAFAWAGGGQSQTPAKAAEPASLKGTSISILMGTMPWYDFVRPILDEFTKATGIKYDLETQPETQLRNKIVVELTARSKNIDVYSCSPAQEIPMFTKNGWVEPLDDYIAKSADYDFADFIPGAIGGSQIGGKTYAIPLFTERPVIYYRTDILKAKGVAVPTTMDELMAAAQKLHDPANKVYGFAERGIGAGSITQFYAWAYSFGGSPQSKDFRKATLNTPEMMKAYEYYGEILGKYGPPGVLNMNWGETLNLLNQGLVAIRIDCDSQFAPSLDPSKSTVSDKIAFAPLPDGPAGFGAWNTAPWALCIPSFSTKKAAAWEFLHWATTKEMSARAFKEGGQFATRKSPWNDASVTASLPPTMVAAVQKTLKSPFAIERPVTIQVGKARDIMGVIVQAAIQGTRGAELQKIADKQNAEFQALLDEDYK